MPPRITVVVFSLGGGREGSRRNGNCLAPRELDLKHDGRAGVVRVGARRCVSHHASPARRGVGLEAGWGGDEQISRNMSPSAFCE